MAAAPTTKASGSKASTVGTTPDNLANVAGPGVFQLIIDLSVMASGDLLFVDTKVMVLTGGTARYAGLGKFYPGAQPAKDLIHVGAPIATDITDSTALVFEINQTQGTTRTYPWKVIQF